MERLTLPDLGGGLRWTSVGTEKYDGSWSLPWSLPRRIERREEDGSYVGLGGTFSSRRRLHLRKRGTPILGDRVIDRVSWPRNLVFSYQTALKDRKKGELKSEKVQCSHGHERCLSYAYVVPRVFETQPLDHAAAGNF